MSFPLVVVLAAWLSAAASSETSGPASHDEGPTSSPIDARAYEPPAAVIVVGTTAPDFSFQTVEGSWRHLHDLLSEGPVLLVFGAREAELRALERERNALLDLGVMPVAIVDGRPGRVASMVRRMGLASLVVPDARHVVASQFNLVQPPTLAPVPAWFVIDRQARVRRLQRGRLPSTYASQTAQALGLPLPGATVPASR
jgi:peroxiredoxin